jgi:hypothetical protein
MFFSFIVFCLYGTHSTNVTFVPTPIRITVADLPSPFATTPAYEYKNIIPVPSDPHLLVHDGFQSKCT